MRKIITTIVLITQVLFSYADVTLPKVFGSNMVLQRDRNILIWGWASPKEKISVQFNKQTKNITAGKDGKWKISLAPELPGGPFQLLIKGKNTITLNNILVGDVWICSGQSNMAWNVRESNNWEEEIRNANYPNIRQIIIPNKVAAVPQQDISTGEWKVCTPENAGEFTAVGYFFARELTKELNIPVGLINTSWGGTHSETWTSREAFENSDAFKTMISGMPKLNLDSLEKIRSAAITKKIESSQGPLIPASQAASWKEVKVDDSRWGKMNVPGLWEWQSLDDFDGVLWYRKNFALDSDAAGKEGVLDLAMIDDSDETFINGVRVGGKSRYNEKRNYAVPAGILREGNNTIAVRVVDTGGGGGIYGEEGDVRLTIGEKVIPLAGKWSYRVESISQNALSISPNSYPTLLFNAMINPLLPLGIKGAIWYQGEANAGRAFQYRKAFPLMINDWRKRWGQDFPFYFVQLATYGNDHGDSQKGSTWAELREAQTMTLSLPNTGMAVTTDIGDPMDIHPRNKQDVGKRLAAIALNRTYGKTRIDSGPVFQSLVIKGDKAIITFSNTGSGLMVKDRYGYLKGFEIAGDDMKFKYAKAHIVGNTVEVHQDGISQPVAVRFGWADDASDNNLFNAEGFPAVPFRTDHWKGITEDAKFTIEN